MSEQETPFCWLCFINHVGTRLDAESRCPIHGLVKDRVLGLVLIDERFFASGQRGTHE